VILPPVVFPEQSYFFRPPPGWIGPDPSKGSEVFVGKAPRDCFEDELVPVNYVRLSNKGRRIQGNLNEGKVSVIDFLVLISN
jgi:hypothetical protein